MELKQTSNYLIRFEREDEETPRRSFRNNRRARFKRKTGIRKEGRRDERAMEKSKKQTGRVRRVL